MYSRCLLLSLPAAPLTFAPHNKRGPLNALYGVKVGVLESCHLIGFEDFAIPQSPNVVLLHSNNCCVVLEPAICEDLDLHVAIFIYSK